MEKFEEKYREYQGFFEGELKGYCAKMKYFSKVLTESMRYSLLSGGKRVRPVLLFAALELFGKEYRDEVNLAIALEMVHTYSLIHDDLPAMDNDDFRRGNPSSHKVFGEANAILAGDALLNEAFVLLLQEAGRGEEVRRAAYHLARAAGAEGMVAGQSADLLYEGKEVSGDELDFIYIHKTGKLIAAPVVMAAILAGADETLAEKFGLELGRLFQITDDLLDVKGDSARVGKTLGKDEQEDKATCVKVYGVERCELLADESAAKCLKLLDKFNGEPNFLRGMVDLVRSRDN